MPTDGDESFQGEREGGGGQSSDFQSPDISRSSTGTQEIKSVLLLLVFSTD